MQIIELDDLSRPELAPFARLTEAQLRNRRDPEQGLFIAESPKVIEKALEKAAGEKVVRKAIESGVTATAAFEKYGIL